MFLVNIGTIAFFIILLICGIFDVQTFFSAFIPILISIPLAIWNSNAMSDKMKIMGLSIDYMLNQGGVTIDDVLGILISDKARKRVAEPTRSFFVALKNLCEGGTAEQRRRVAESLPALYRLNKKETKNIIEKKLRDDFDDLKWHDDNRRRTIEALRYFPKKENSFIKKCLIIRRKDTIFTVIAVVEIILLYKKFKPEEKTELINSLKLQVRTHQLGQDVLNFIDASETFLEGLTQQGKDTLARCNYVRDKFISTQDNYLKILISKNILYVGSNLKKCIRENQCQDTTSCASCIIALFDLCFDSNNQLNIRRPMAKEDVCFCLLCMLEYSACRDDAKKRIMSLIKEQDMIIAITAFDYIHKVLEIDKPLFNDILRYCLALPDQGPWTELKSRAEHVRDTVGFA